MIALCDISITHVPTIVDYTLTLLRDATEKSGESKHSTRNAQRSDNFGGASEGLEFQNTTVTGASFTRVIAGRARTSRCDAVSFLV